MIRPIGCCLIIIVLAGCKTSEKRTAAEPAFTTATVTVSYDGAYFPVGMAVVAHTTGVVSFCRGKCFEVGKISPSRFGTIAINGGIAADPATGYVSRFYVTNVVTGDVLACTLKSVKPDYGGDYNSGSCKSLGAAPH